MIEPDKDERQGEPAEPTESVQHVEPIGYADETVPYALPQQRNWKYYLQARYSIPAVLSFCIIFCSVIAAVTFDRINASMTTMATATTVANKTDMTKTALALAHAHATATVAAHVHASATANSQAAAALAQSNATATSVALAQAQATATVISQSTLTPVVHQPVSYEAEADANTLAGGAKVVACDTCSGGKKVGYVGYSGTLQFNNIVVNSPGNYTLTLYYCTSETRTVYISVNGANATPVSMAPTGSFTTVGTQSISVQLNQGSNTITLSNHDTWAPDFDRIVV